MMPRRVRLAVLIAFLCHGLFIVTARYRLSYDAFTHMLFANHYAEHWFSLWETRWYTGFTVVSYPPLVHQLIAIFIPVLGFARAFALILWLATTLYPLGVYAFSRILTGYTSASYAALASALLLPIFVTAHIFGQLPFLASTLLALFSAGSLNRYLREGGEHNFLLTISLYTTTMAAHHATLLVQPFFIFAVIAKNILSANTSNSWRKANFRQSVSAQLIIRTILFVATTTLTSLLVIFPFWQWGSTQVIQMPIDHLSRHNFIADPLAIAIFFLPLYGPFIAIIPFVLFNWHPRFIGLQISFTLLFLLGLGGTTPLPKMLFGSAWEWLTYDRFAFWACLSLTPFFGVLFIRMKKKLRLILKPRPVTLRRVIPSALTFSLLTITSLGAWFTPYFIRLQPDPINMQPIVDFLNSDDRSQYRYLTFGFGDQFVYLNLLTQATTIDGSYHTARTLPELRNSGLGQIDTSYWALNGMNAIVPILQKSGDHGVRWGFVNPATVETIKENSGTTRRSPFIPVLEKLGWLKIKTLSNGILVFENPRAILPASSTPPMALPVTAFEWGVLPMLTLIITLSLSGLRVYPIQTERILRAVYALTISIIPIALGFWIFQPIANFPQPRVYLTYTDALFFFSDALALLAVTIWLIGRVQKTITRSSNIINLFALFCLLTTISVVWSNNVRTSAYISMHIWLAFLLILSLRDNKQAWNFIIYGLCASLAIQIITGVVGFALQSTAFLDSFNMQFPGTLDSSMRGASVVQLASGLRILRAYGTLPHPNILGGLTLMALLGPASLYLEKQNRLALVLLSFGIILLLLTFSRSAWLGFLIFMIVIIFKAGHFEFKRIVTFISICVISILCAFYPLRDLILARTINSTVVTEQISTLGRSWLADQARTIFQHHPLAGVGIGSFTIELSKVAPEGANIEPVHNIFLLAASELGILGVLFVIGIGSAIGYYAYKSISPKAILSSAALSGFGAIGLFDHYLWSLAPGRIMLAFAVGLWLGHLQYET